MGCTCSIMGYTCSTKDCTCIRDPESVPVDSQDKDLNRGVKSAPTANPPLGFASGTSTASKAPEALGLPPSYSQCLTSEPLAPEVSVPSTSQHLASIHPPVSKAPDALPASASITPQGSSPNVSLAISTPSASQGSVPKALASLTPEVSTSGSAHSTSQVLTDPGSELTSNITPSLAQGLTPDTASQASSFKGTSDWNIRDLLSTVKMLCNDQTVSTLCLIEIFLWQFSLKGRE